MHPSTHSELEVEGALFKRPTLFVIGAGAGFDIDMPLGEKLSDKIADSLQIRFNEQYEMIRYPLHLRRLSHGDSHIRDALHLVSEKNELEFERLIAAAETIGSAVQNMRSIDNFVLAHSHDQRIATCAKIAIVQRILEAERTSYMGPLDGSGFRRDAEVRKSWYHDFLMCLLEGVEQERNLENIFDNVSVITFNYDRCLEHFLHYRLLQTFPSKGEEYFSGLLTKKLKIKHPYGVVGKLPWQVLSGAVEFGAAVSPHQLKTLAPQVKTYSERIEDETALKEPDDMVSSARVIVFLGFHFHQQNMELLKSSGPKIETHVTVHATTFQRSAADLRKIESQIGAMLEKRTAVQALHISERLDCKKMFTDYASAFV